MTKTINTIPNFTLAPYAKKVISQYSHKLVPVDDRPGFYEDINTSREVLKPVPIQHKDQIKFEGHETESEKEAIVILNNLIAMTRDEIQKHYGVGPLTNFEGGLVKLGTGAFNGLHSDMYNMDGTRYDGEGRGDSLDYSALIYLSEYGTDFTGGELYFPKQDITIEPRLGTLVFFQGDLEHLHEVKEVTSGERYALVMFFG